jgi:hypothetical protein
MSRFFTMFNETLPRARPSLRMNLMRRRRMLCKTITSKSPNNFERAAVTHLKLRLENGVVLIADLPRKQRVIPSFQAQK